MIPFYNDHAANERTFLAWIRTGLTIMAFGFVLGVAATAFYLGQPRTAEARNDRYEDYVMCTGAAAANPASLMLRPRSLTR